MSNEVEKVIDETRGRERYDFNKNILCLRCKDVSKSIKTKIPILLSLFDISYSGIGAKSSVRLIAGSILTFNLFNKFGSREVHVEVIWCKHVDFEYRCGLKFINLTYDDVLFIDEIIRYIR